MKPVLETLVDRRSFFKSAGMAAAGASALSFATEGDAEAALQNVNTRSKPSDLKITDLRVAVIAEAPMTCPLIRIDTNQGISGYGEVRDGASETYALMLKSRILGENPCNVDKVFRKIKQFGGPARQAGGVCGVEMACWDLAGKAFGRAGLPDARRQVPRPRPALRRHAPRRRIRRSQGQRLKERMDARPHVPEDGHRHRPHRDDAGRGLGAHRADGAGAGADHAPVHRDRDHRQGRRAPRRSTWAGIREVIGMEVPLASDHFGHIGVNCCIKLARAMEKWNLAWMEDMVPWQFPHLLKKITDAMTSRSSPARTST